MSTTHAAYSHAIRELKLAERRLKVLRSYVEELVDFPAKGGTAIEDPEATEFCNGVCGFLQAVTNHHLWLELESSAGAFTAEEFQKCLQRKR